MTGRPLSPRAHSRAVDAAVMVVVTALGVIGVFGEVVPDGIGPADVAGLVLGAAVIATVPWRRPWPVPFALVALLAGTVAPLCGFVGLVGVYTVAVHRRWPTALAVAAVAMVVSVVDLAFEILDPVEYRWVLGVAATLTVAATGWGMFARARRQLLDSLRERAERAEAEQELRADRARTAERRRIAREMHDVLGHRLSLLSVHAGALELRHDLPPETVHRTAAVLRETARAAMDDLREVVLVLRDLPEGENESDGPQPRLSDLPELVAQSREAGAGVDLVPPDALLPAAPPEQLGRTAYRVVQEGLTNARRHAAGAPVSVEVSGRPGAALSVRVVTGRADRRSANPDGPGSGTGLIGLRERVALAGGELGHGTDAAGRHVLTARMPWPAESPATVPVSR